MVSIGLHTLSWCLCNKDEVVIAERGNNASIDPSEYIRNSSLMMVHILHQYDDGGPHAFAYKMTRFQRGLSK